MRPVAAGVIVRSGRVLLVRRAVPEGELVWHFPAGKIEPGETPAEAAVRETAEETRLAVQATVVLGDRIHPKTGRHVTYVACRVLEGEAVNGAPREIAEIAWVSHADIPEYVPYGLFEPVQAWLDEELAGQGE